MKRITLLIVGLAIVNATYSQMWKDKVPSNVDSKEQLNFYEIQKEFNSHWEAFDVKKGRYIVDGKEQKVPGWKQFKRWEWFWETRIDRVTGELPTVSLYEIQKDYLKLNNTKADQSSWTSMGPNSSAGGYAGVGRINCIAFHPTNQDIFWVGTPSGGLWKTTDGGASWNSLTDNLPIIGVTDIVLANDYETSKTIYIATGDRDGSDNYSIGILKSTDDGVTWQTTGLTWSISESGNAIIKKFMKNPNNSDILYVGYNGKIRKSTNAGDSWIAIADGYIFDMDLKPNCEDTTIYAVRYNYDNGNTEFIKSSDAGSNWITTHTFNSDVYRVDLAVSKADSTVVYALACNNDGGLEGVYKSTNSGLSFSKVYNGMITGNNLMGYFSDGSGPSSGQGWYDIVLVVSPTNINTLFLGGINTWKSTNGGLSWYINNMWTTSSYYNSHGAPAVHADKHYFIYQDDNTLFEGNDGGVYKTTDGGANWTDLTNGMVISQIYKLGVSQTKPEDVITGLQDNGSKLFYSDTWYDVKGGDGMECIIDYTNNDIQYATYVNGQIDKTSNLWNSREDITDFSRFPGGNTGAWVSPYILNPKKNTTILLGYEDVYKSTNGGDSWTKISNLNLTNDIRVIEMSYSDTNVIYISDHNRLYKTENGGSSWVNLTALLPSTSSALTSIEVNDKDKNHLWITYGSYNNTIVYESVDGGMSWTDISAGLPAVPASTIIHNNKSSEIQLYIGTDLGVYFKDGDSNWEIFSNNLPSVIVTELEIYYDETTPSNSVLYASTYGRGLWKSVLASFEEPVISINNIEGPFFISNDSSALTDISYTINETFSSNTFTAYLSDEDGDFTSEIPIGEITSDIAGTIECTIPAGLASGTNYKVKIKSSNPVAESAVSNSFQIVLDNDAPTVSITSSEVGSTSADPINLTITFNENVNGFEQSDIVVTNSTITSFNDTNAPQYFVQISPEVTGEITVDIPAAVALDVVGNENLAADSWSISFIHTGIDNLEQMGIKMYPNPFNGIIVLEFTENYKTLHVDVYDVQGKLVFNNDSEFESIKKFNLSNLKQGIYFLNIVMDGKTVQTKLLKK